jgi:hypothetical protein
LHAISFVILLCSHRIETMVYSQFSSQKMFLKVPWVEIINKFCDINISNLKVARFNIQHSKSWNI